MKKSAYPPEASTGRKYSFSRSQEAEEEDLEDGGGGCRRNVWSFAVSFGLAALFTSTLSVYITSQVTALQKQYELSSTAVGAILSCNDVGFLATVLLVSHLGHRAHIPRLLALATLLFGLSGVLSALTYFLNPAALPTPSSLPPGGSSNASASPLQSARLCGAGNKGQGRACKESGEEGDDDGSGNMAVLVLLGLSMVLQGVAKAPRVSLSTTYVDDNTPDKARTSLYMGFIMTLTIFGPPVAIFVGGLFQKLPVDLKETLLTPRHPDWVGCWWLGFLVFGVAAIFVGLPLFLFPRSMRTPRPPPDAYTPAALDLKEQAKVKDVPVSAAAAAAAEKEEGGKKEAKAAAMKAPKKLAWKLLKGLPVSLLRVLRQPVYTLTLFGIVSLQFGVSGEISFGPKYVEHQFQMPAYKTNLVLGTQKIIGATVGTFLGGLLTSRLRLGRLGCLKFLMCALSVAIAFKSLNFYFGCDNPSIRGLRYSQGQQQAAAVVVADTAPGGCDCSGAPYFPVCGDNSTSFFSPCFAGCTNLTSSSGYSGCSETAGGEVTPGLCESDCPWLYYYMAADLCAGLVGTLGIMPAFITLIRSVDEDDRSIAMGLFTFLSSLLAFLPGPIVFGGVIDSTCLLWKGRCGGAGVCELYDIASQRWRLKGLVLGLFGLALLLLLLALLAVVRHERGARVASYKEQQTSPSPAPGHEEAREEKVTKF